MAEVDERVSPRTEAGRLLLMAGLTFHSGRRLADHPELLAAIEAQAVTADRERMAQAVESGEWDDVFRPAVEQAIALDRAALVAAVREPRFTRHQMKRTWDSGNPEAVDGWVTWCDGCGQRPWPCDTAAVLGLLNEKGDEYAD